MRLPFSPSKNVFLSAPKDFQRHSCALVTIICAIATWAPIAQADTLLGAVDIFNQQAVALDPSFFKVGVQFATGNIATTLESVTFKAFDASSSGPNIDEFTISLLQAGNLTPVFSETFQSVVEGDSLAAAQGVTVNVNAWQLAANSTYGVIFTGPSNLQMVTGYENKSTTTLAGHAPVTVASGWRLNIGIYQNAAGGSSFGGAVIGPYATRVPFIELNGVATVASSVPEPQTLALWLAGLGVCGFAIRARRA